MELGTDDGWCSEGWKSIKAVLMKEQLVTAHSPGGGFRQQQWNMLLLLNPFAVFVSGLVFQLPAQYSS